VRVKRESTPVGYPAFQPEPGPRLSIDDLLMPAP
jgi:hypothetical protein